MFDRAPSPDWKKRVSLLVKMAHNLFTRLFLAVERDGPAKRNRYSSRLIDAFLAIRLNCRELLSAPVVKSAAFCDRPPLGEPSQLPSKMKTNWLLAEEVYRRVGELLPQLIRSRQQEKLNKVIEGLLPEMAPSRAAFLQARMQARMQADAKAHILSSGDYVRAREIARLAGYSVNNPSTQPSKWKREEAIFAIEHNGADYFPLYGLNPEKSYKPYPALCEVLAVFHGMRSGWSIAFWFAGLNSFLNDRRPQDLLASKPEMVIAAARDEIEGLQHG
jgi:hypothetical protein